MTLDTPMAALGASFPCSGRPSTQGADVFSAQRASAFLPVLRKLLEALHRQSKAAMEEEDRGPPGPWRELCGRSTQKGGRAGTEAGGGRDSRVGGQPARLPLSPRPPFPPVFASRPRKKLLFFPSSPGFRSLATQSFLLTPGQLGQSEPAASVSPGSRESCRPPRHPPGLPFTSLPGDSRAPQSRQHRPRLPACRGRVPGPLRSTCVRTGRPRRRGSARCCVGDDADDETR